MNKKITLFTLVLIFIAMFGVYYTYSFTSFTMDRPDDSSGNQIACTMDAKQCPDGSYVGRQGPKCEFAKCPDSTSKPVKLGQSIVMAGIKVTPVKVVQDSRCPEGVQCIWAGTVIVKTKFESLDGNMEVMEMDVELGKSFDVLGKWGNLEKVSPKSEKGYDFTYILKNYER